MNFRSMIRFTLMARKTGWYACRQHMLHQGYSVQNITEVLICLLRLQGDLKTN